METSIYSLYNTMHVNHHQPLYHKFLSTQAPESFAAKAAIDENLATQCSVN